ncbi:dihydrofolate reductase family protein [Pseudenhygromyxa sp. WMMC2535]|uniref:dihydrofolate reductase family protein n=1 Tax=Pseudenhygromyxa sp. WMMC2535 TaxID=2712867 RepID=UPI001553B533|nr:dihydrofolate reductase family protein [Pseudenhygromyxa sp. WMMC2535]NVB39029.1 dihydrofolate reductase family protein [Pseudenhygromyxa sp. WMMC2535]
MGQLSITAFVSLDGVMQGPGGAEEDRDGGFSLGGWVMPHFSDDDGGFMAQTYASADAFLLGRRTYDIFASHWPRVRDPEHPIGGPLNRLPKYVGSRGEPALPWGPAERVGADLVAEINALKARYEDLQCHGSASFAQSLLEHDLIDVFRVLTYPVVLGGGKRLFGAGAGPMGMTLASVQTSSGGVLMATYRRSGPVRQGEPPSPD